MEDKASMMLTSGDIGERKSKECRRSVEGKSKGAPS